MEFTLSAFPRIPPLMHVRCVRTIRIISPLLSLRFLLLPESRLNCVQRPVKCIEFQNDQCTMWVKLPDPRFDGWNTDRK
jgi:hypothetical protein